MRDGFRIFSDFHRLLICVKRVGRLVFVQVELLDEGLLPFQFLGKMVGVLEGLANLFVQVFKALPSILEGSRVVVADLLE